ncbi:MAG TPA: FkbM family methyltransferase, partial [Acetobacteraceae bacterium]|nr:FkbM family methyltransferase [Acetobacteraceae bacterium]
MAAHAITRSRLPGERSMHLVTDLADRMVGETIRRTGGWEPAETALVETLVAPGDCAVDVGAHVGYFTVLLSALVGRTGRVVAFEPEPGNFELLKANCILNGCANVVLEARALGDRSGRAELYLAAANLGDHRLHATPGRSTRQVAVVRFDDYWTGDRLDFLKLDAQGGEPVILDGGARTIEANAGRLLCLMELSPGLCQAAGHDCASVLALLRRLQTRIFAVGIAES